MSSARPLSVLLRLLVAVLAIAVLAYVGTNVAAVTAAGNLREELSAELTRRLADRVSDVRRTSAAVSERLGEEPSHVLVVQECGIDRAEAGLVVQDHREVCTFRSGMAWPVADEDEARRAVAGVTGLARLRRPAAEGCRAVAHGEAGTAAYVAPARQRSAPWCLAGLVPPELRPHRVVEGASGLPAADRGWLVVHRDEPLLEESLGCSHWSVLFCGDPFGGEPAWGDSPG